MKVKSDPRSKLSNLGNWKDQAWKKSGLQRDSNPWPPRYRCDALPTELWSHTLGARSIYLTFTCQNKKSHQRCKEKTLGYNFAVFLNLKWLVAVNHSCAWIDNTMVSNEFPITRDQISRWTCLSSFTPTMLLFCKIYVQRSFLSIFNFQKCS